MIIELSEEEVEILLDALDGHDCVGAGAVFWNAREKLEKALENDQNPTEIEPINISLGDELTLKEKLG